MVYSFDNKKNYKEYKSKGGKYENFITKGISWYDQRPSLRDMINDHKTPMKLPNNETTSGERKIQLIMLNKCILIKIFKKLAIYIHKIIM